MASIRKCAVQIRQPWGGYLKRRKFSIKKLPSNSKLNFRENIPPEITELAVDYLARYMIGSSAQDAFASALNSASLAKERSNANVLLHNIKGLNNKSIISACKLAGYELLQRTGKPSVNPVSQIMPNTKTIRNIKQMVNRSLNFWDKYGPVVSMGFSFEGGYTFTVTSGKGDYQTQDTLWILSTSRRKPNKIHTLKLLMYYIMGQHSSNSDLHSITKLGIYNPRQNKVYLINVSEIKESVIETVSRNVIGYGVNPTR